jgi:tRNA-uridine 2-sulfurtransferase
MTKVVVAMSGGVDSSVAAALLQSQGYEVVGMMLRLWSEEGKAESNRCCTPEAMALARRVAAKLGIPFYVIDAKEVFRGTVVQYFLDGYARGETPNPCLLCNSQIRWTYLLDHALALGAEFMATGHYARTRRLENGTINLLRGVDAAKDQSYVLHILNQEKLGRAMFPVGAHTKPEIRKIAEGLGLPTAARHDSQDLCFLAGDDYRRFLERNAGELLRRGPIIARDGTVLGEHSGLAAYTIGQRKGLGVASAVPLYVLGKEVATNSLRVGTADELGSDDLTTGDVHWTSGLHPEGAFRASVKIRYTAKEAPAEVRPLENGKGVHVQFDEPQRDITAGQAAVFYDGDVVIGGGIIQ